MPMSSVSVLAQSFRSGGAALEHIGHQPFEVLPPDDDGHSPAGVGYSP